MNQTWNPSLFENFHNDEHDACGIVACLEKNKQPTRQNIFDCINALVGMNHRAGFINGEGDGVGIHIDIPTELWKEKLRNAGVNEELVDQEEFAVGHIFVSRKADWEFVKNELIQKLEKAELTLVYENDQVTNSYCPWPDCLAREPSFLAIRLCCK